MTAWAEDEDLEVWLLERYCSGTASAKEAAQIEEWFREHPEQRTWYEQFRADLRKGGFFVFTTERRHAAWVEILREACLRCPETEAVLMELVQPGDGAAGPAYQQQSDNLPLRPGLPQAVPAARPKEGGGFWRTLPRGGFKTQPLRGWKWRTLAAVVMGAAVFVAGWKLGGAHLFRRMTLPAAPYTTYATANGQRATITLPDGNSVVLNVASRLEVPANYGTGNHVVRLPVGEALFTVSHHVAGTPFTVVAGPAVARVLGTSFVVRHYGTDTTAMVAVADGKVAVGAQVVTAQQVAEIGRQVGVRLRPARPSQFSFATGVLVLDSMRVSNAIPELNRWYNADIRLGDAALADRSVEGNCTAGSLGDLAAILEMTLDVRVVRNGRVLTLYPRMR